MEQINHTNAVRLRVTGSGNLQMTLYGLDKVKSQDLTAYAMSSTNFQQPTILANFSSQRTKLRVYTLAIDETFKINKIILFMRPIYTGYPQ